MPFLSRGKFSPALRTCRIQKKIFPRTCLSPIIREDRNYSEFLSRKAELAGGEGLIHGGQGNGTPVFFGEISSGSSINAKSRHPGKATDIKFARIVSDEGSVARGTTRPTSETEYIRKRAVVKGEPRHTHLQGNRSILAEVSFRFRLDIRVLVKRTCISRGKLRRGFNLKASIGQSWGIEIVKRFDAKMMPRKNAFSLRWTVFKTHIHKIWVATCINSTRFSRDRILSHPRKDNWNSFFE